jgi:hypothetical protein
MPEEEAGFAPDPRDYSLRATSLTVRFVRDGPQSSSITRCLFPIIDIPTPLAFTAKVGGFVLLCQLAATALFHSYRRRARAGRVAGPAQARIVAAEAFPAGIPAGAEPNRPLRHSTVAIAD